MGDELLPCKCGHDGELLGQRHAGFFSLTCPKCHEAVEAFTTDGLAVAWNKQNAKPQEPSQ